LSGVITSHRGNGSFVRAEAHREPTLPESDKTAKLGELYERMKSEANGFGISESEIQRYILRRSEK